MRFLLVLVGLAALIVVVLMSLGMISIDQTKTAALPSVQVNGGEAPKFNVNVGSVGVGSTNTTVEVPTVGTTEKTIAVPTIEVKQAGNAAAQK